MHYDDAARDKTATCLSHASAGRSLGRLTDAISWVAGCQGTTPPHSLDDVRVAAFIGKHGCADSCFEGTPPTLVAEADIRHAVADLEAPAAHGPIAVAAQAAGVPVRVIDKWSEEASGSIDHEDAMDQATYEAAWDAGAHAADADIDAGADALIPLNIAAAQSTVAAVLMGAISQTEPVAIVGPGSGINDAVWKAKVSIIRNALYRVRRVQAHRSPADLLRVAGSPDLVATTAYMAHAAERRTPVLLDGVATLAAAALAERIAPGARQWFLNTTSSAEPAHRVASRELQLEPLLDLEIRPPFSLGALLALPLLNTAFEAAATILSDDRLEGEMTD